MKDSCETQCLLNMTEQHSLGCQHGTNHTLKGLLTDLVLLTNNKYDLSVTWFCIQCSEVQRPATKPNCMPGLDNKPYCNKSADSESKLADVYGSKGGQVIA